MNLTQLTALAAGVAGHPAAGLVAFQAASGADLSQAPERRRRTLRRARRSVTTAPVTAAVLPVSGLNHATRDNATTPAAQTASAGAGSR